MSNRSTGRRSVTPRGIRPVCEDPDFPTVPASRPRPKNRQRASGSHFVGDVHRRFDQRQFKVNTDQLVR
jgi:hypothetical protein